MLAFSSLLSLQGFAQDKDPVKVANKENDAKKLVDDDIADFLVKSADARMMDAQEGKLAVEKGTTQSMKDYGKLMLKDQAKLLAEIKKLAKKKNVSLPDGISNKKEDGREDLKEKNGKEFDEKFIKMMIIDHERDIKLFEEAAEHRDAEVSAFAKKYLPMIQSHLSKINKIKQSASGS